MRIKIRRDAIYAVARARRVRGEHRRSDIIMYAVTAVCVCVSIARHVAITAVAAAARCLGNAPNNGYAALTTRLALYRVYRVTLAQTASYSRDERAI